MNTFIDASEKFSVVRFCIQNVLSAPFWKAPTFNRTACETETRPPDEPFILTFDSEAASP
jgi:hypothetical protein